jgi:hypothetical protein
MNLIHRKLTHFFTKLTGRIGGIRVGFATQTMAIRRRVTFISR